MAERGNSKVGWLGGLTIGVLWLAMAATTLLSSYQGYQNDRRDWGLAWGLVGMLLLGAGLAAIVGTWWHYRRVLKHHD